MQPENEANCPPGREAADLPEVAVMSARESLRRDLKDLEVPAGSAVTLSPYEREYADRFARVEIKSFDDLQVVGFVPRGLSEDKVRRAIDEDDAEALRMAHNALANPPAAGGGCECAHPGAADAGRGDLRQHYERARKRFNPSLSRVISEHLRTRVEWDSPVAVAVRKWAQRVGAGGGRYGTAEYVPAHRFTILQLIIRDVIINRGATLHVEPSVQNFLARWILIHRTGRLVHGGGYLKIWASTVAPLANLSLTVAAADPIPWALAN